MQGTLQDRIQSCNQTKTTGSFIWRLVNSHSGNNSWLDEKSGLIWSELSYDRTDPNAENYQKALDTCEGVRLFGNEKFELPTIKDYFEANSHGILDTVNDYGGNDSLDSPRWFWTKNKCSKPWPSGCFMGVYWEGRQIYSRNIWQTGKLANVKCVLRTRKPNKIISAEGPANFQDIKKGDYVAFKIKMARGGKPDSRYITRHQVIDVVDDKVIYVQRAPSYGCPRLPDAVPCKDITSDETAGYFQVCEISKKALIAQQERASKCKDGTSESVQLPNDSHIPTCKVRFKDTDFGSMGDAWLTASGPFLGVAKRSLMFSTEVGWIYYTEELLEYGNKEFKYENAKCSPW